MATRYPAQWLEELRSRADILTVVSEYVPLKPRGSSYWGLCPFHGEKTPSFKVDPDQGLFYCFGCKAGGTVFSFVMEAERMEFSEAVRYLAEKVRMPLPTEVDAAEAARQRSLRERIQALNREAARFYHETLYTPEGEDILRYLHGRGLDDPAIRAFGLGAAPSGWDTLTKRLQEAGAAAAELTSAGLTVQKETNRFDMFRSRAMFPIISAHGAVLGFGGRAMGDQQPKYLNTADTPAFNKRHHVYAVNLLRKARGLTRVLLVEGYMDVVSLIRHGVQGVVATLGTSLTSEQAKLMSRYAPEIWIAYDGDSAGQSATLRALDVLAAQGIAARVVPIPGGMDPDDFIRQEGLKAFEAIAPLSAPQFRMERAREGVDMGSEEGRTQYAIACAAILRTVSQPVEVENLLKRLMVDTGYSREVLIQQIGISEPVRPAAHASTLPHPRRETVSPPPLSDRMVAERKLLSLMGTGQVPEGIVQADRFDDTQHRFIAQALLDGKRPAELLDDCEDEALRGAMLAIFGDEPHVVEDALLPMITDCLERMRRGWIDERIKTLKDSLQTASGDEKITILKEIQTLNDEKKDRLRPGRKE